MENNIRSQRKSFEGVVVSDKMKKTRVISVERVVRDVLYSKTMRKQSRFYAHDESNESKVGDRVEIISTRPLSKLKRWRVSRIVNKA
ncbi:MAG: 30S ribosomal protein S17 [Elusimicrobia bacterium]|nr:30S ribosomal protein S17 [Elusimicrobiota bacterium]